MLQLLVSQGTAVELLIGTVVTLRNSTARSSLHLPETEGPRQGLRLGGGGGVRLTQDTLYLLKTAILNLMYE